MTIYTTKEYPPIPIRDYDWHAVFDIFCCDEEQPHGWGETEESAVINLLKNATEFEDDGYTIEEVTDLALEGWKASK